jgi:2-(1,2-epoxy-1,2-dihydrophenyl)acetyl-CoA isomerase
VTRPLIDVQIAATGVATVALARPEVLNALTTELIERLTETAAALAADDAVRVVLLTGQGRAFCAGADLCDPMMGADRPPAERGTRFVDQADRTLNRLVRGWNALRKPKVHAVNGPAVGGGAALALMGDIVFAARSAYFQQPFVPQLGLVPDMGASWQFMRRAGPARAIGAAMLGDRIDAERAMRWGLIWDCVDDDRLFATATETAERLARGAPRALAALPALMWSALDGPLDAQLDRERDAQAALVQTDDFIEALEAFAARRAPQFRGR